MCPHTTRIPMLRDSRPLCKTAIVTLIDHSYKVIECRHHIDLFDVHTLSLCMSDQSECRILLSPILTFGELPVQTDIGLISICSNLVASMMKFSACRPSVFCYRRCKLTNLISTCRVTSSRLCSKLPFQRASYLPYINRTKSKPGHITCNCAICLAKDE